MFNQHYIKFKNLACLRERETYNNKLNVLMRRLDTYVHKIFSCKVSFKCRCQGAS